MSPDRNAFKDEVTACLRKDADIVALVDCVARHFPDLEVYRENDDLIAKRARRFLIVRRAGPDQFLISQHVAVPSTNEVDFGGGMKRNVDDLFNEISALSQG
jgi:hypothetical protein